MDHNRLGTLGRRREKNVGAMAWVRLSNQMRYSHATRHMPHGGDLYKNGAGAHGSFSNSSLPLSKVREGVTDAKKT